MSIPYIPLPFILAGTNKDLGDNPISEKIIGIFQNKHFLGSSYFEDVKSQIEKYIKDDWLKFQNEKLIPAINEILKNIDTTSTLDEITKKYGAFNPRDKKMVDLTGASHGAITNCDEYNKTIVDPLSKLEFYATNLYTKEDSRCGDVQFYRTLNRILLQHSNDGKTLNINKHPYDDSKKIFNVWLFLFLSGLQKLLVEVPPLYKNESGFENTVRLYRGMNVSADFRKELWSKPILSEDENVSHKLYLYSTLAFSSWSTKLDVVCKYFSTGEPCFFIYERKTIILPCLKPVSDIPTEDEYLTFPFFSLVINNLESTNDGSKIFGEKCGTSSQTITWIGVNDPKGSDSDVTSLEFKLTSSGGRKDRNKVKGMRARKYKNNTKKLNKHKRKRYNNSR